jgi:thymidylate synthase (FAD)
MGNTNEIEGNEVFSCPAECSKDQWIEAIEYCQEAYKVMIDCGASPQIARSVFPNALASRIIITGNLRNWRHFFIMRTTKEAHPQMRQVTIPLLEEFKSKIPILFDDLEPLTKQTESMKRMR